MEKSFSLLKALTEAKKKAKPKQFIWLSLNKATGGVCLSL